MHNNLTAEIEARLPEPVIQLVRTIGRTAARCGFNSYLVGGIVRDILLKRSAVDIDIMIEGNAIKLAQAIADSAQAKLTIHKAFGTASFALEGYRIDLSTCRGESYDHPGALPRVRPGDICDDLLRRDFSINSMAICINPVDFGLLTDLYGGIADLEGRVIRVMHDGSFEDDATRIMRAVRYEQRLGFKLERKTALLLKQDADILDTISSDRLKHEVLLWLAEPQPGSIIRRAGQLGVLRKLHPSLKWTRPMQTAFGRALKVREGTANTHLYFCLMAYQMDEDALYELLQRLNLLGSKYDLLSHQSLVIKNRLPQLDSTSIKNSQIFSLVKDVEPLAAEVNWLYPNRLAVRRNLRLYLEKLVHIKTSVTGSSLTGWGVKEGPLVGTILNKLLAARLDGEVKTRAAEARLARRLAGI
jgi:tRNA nucleotidyltransferase (CCA-adding enzyme)